MEKTKTKAAVLAFFFGSMGAHHYYLGRPDKGVFYTAIFLIGIYLTIWENSLIVAGIIGALAFYDLMVLFLMSEKTFNNLYPNTEE